jgi:electron transfer flavoprotein alpha subunit
MALNRIWVFAEANDGKVTPLTLELLAKARTLGGEVAAVYAGADADAVAGVVGAHGAAKVLSVGDLGDQLPGIPVASAIAGAISGGNGPDLVMLGTSYDGRDVAARLSVAIDKPVITNNIDLEVSGDDVVVTEPVFGGTKLVKTKFTAGGPHIALFRPKSFVAEEAGGGAAAVESLAATEESQANITNRVVEEATGPKLDEAAVVVSGGRGLGEKDKYEMIEQLAKLLKAAPGASRAIVDAGWVPYSYQVGQTGKVVKPTVYIAAGISGATQHLVGMKGSKNIIAINKDPEAPIFSIADLGIVGDVHKVLPKLIEALQTR